MKRCSTLLNGALLTAGLLIALPAAHGAVVDLAPVADTALFENRPNNNLGGMSFMPVGTVVNGPVRNRGLMRFDIAGSIPSGALINTVTLRVTVTLAGSFSSPMFDLHRMLASWEEGDNTGNPDMSGSVGSPADAGEPSWNNRSAPSTPWGAPGGLAGTDFAPSASGSRAIASAGSSTFASSTGLVADVQAWLDTPSNNFGWLIKAQNEATLGTARRITSRSVPASAPLLSISYQIAPRIEEVVQSGGQFQFKFMAVTGVPYEVQRRDQAGSGTWMTFTNIGPQNMDVAITIVDQIDSSQQFYQVVSP